MACGSPERFTEVVTKGLSSSLTMSVHQWFGMRTPILVEFVTALAIAVGFLSVRSSVYGPGSFSSACSAAGVIMQFCLIHCLDGAMIENGFSSRCFASRIFSTAF